MKIAGIKLDGIGKGSKCSGEPPVQARNRSQQWIEQYYYSDGMGGDCGMIGKGFKGCDLRPRLGKGDQFGQLCGVQHQDVQYDCPPPSALLIGVI